MTIGRILFDLIVAGVATAGFGLLFRTERRSLLPGAVIGGLGYILYDWIVLTYSSAPTAAFVSCLLVGLLSEAAARVLKGPTTVYATMGVIPMVPGYGMYRTMEYVVQADYARATSVGMETILIAGAIALSLGFSTVIARRLAPKSLPSGEGGSRKADG